MFDETVPTEKKQHGDGQSGAALRQAMNAFLKTALSYIERGWLVLALHTPMNGGCSCRRPDCPHPGKHPHTLHGLLDASIDPATIETWWHQWPDANIAIVTGPESDLVVLDVDPRHGGNDSLRDLESQHGPLPTTLEVQTGGGGRHLYFKYPKGATIGNSSGKLGPGLDVKGSNGYVVAPSSLHASGNRYEWKNAHHPDEVPIASLPAWLLALINAPAHHSSDRGEEPEVIPEGRRNQTLTSLAGAMRRRGKKQDEIEAALLVVNAKRCKPPLDEKEVRAIAKSIAQYEPGARKDTRPSINADIQDLLDVTRQAWDALCRANVPPWLFRFGGLLIRIDKDENGAPVVRELTPDRLRHEIARAAKWIKKKNSEELDAKPPMDVVRDMLATPNPPLPELMRIVESPVVARDGSLLTTPGYHPEAKIIYAPAAGFVVPPVPTQPALCDIQRAKDLVNELLYDFPLVSDADRAHAFALLLLPFARDLIDGPTPNHLIEAPSAGSGKGLLAVVLLFPAVGCHIGVVVEARDDDEWRKRVTAYLREGRPAILLDNLTHPLVSGVVAAALTAPKWDDRLLGKNETVSLPVQCTWATTANNPVLSTEIARRCVRIRIDPKRDRPWQREGFRHPDLRSWVAEHRADLVWAALTLIHAWIKKGRPRPRLNPLGSFEAWSTVIGGILETAGVPGFLMNLNELYDTADQEGAAWREFVARWAEALPDQDVSTEQLLGLAKDVEGLPLGRSESDRGQLVAFGKALAKQRDRVIGDFRITAGSKKQRAARWRLEFDVSDLI